MAWVQGGRRWPSTRSSLPCQPTVAGNEQRVVEGSRHQLQLPKVTNLCAQNFNFWVVVVVVGDAIGGVNVSVYICERKLIFIMWFRISADMYHLFLGSVVTHRHTTSTYKVFTKFLFDRNISLNRINKYR